MILQQLLEDSRRQLGLINALASIQGFQSGKRHTAGIVERVAHDEDNSTVVEVAPSYGFVAMVFALSVERTWVNVNVALVNHLSRLEQPTPWRGSKAVKRWG